jgi:hypothetical protein
MFRSIAIILLFVTQISNAQKEGNNWYFGDCSALTFNSGKPVALKNSTMFTRYGCATISSANGKLLLYTDGRQIYDSTHAQLPGFSFKDAYLCTQSSLIVPWPDSTHLYYIFTPSAKPTDSIKYSVVNMKLRGGKGDVVSGKTEIKLPSLSAGKVNAIRHPNRRDYWVAAPIGNTDSIIVYLITPTGISKQTVKTKTGFNFAAGGAYADNNSGYFKFSPDGKKLCVVILGDSSVLADFDGTSGKLSNIWGFNYKSGSMGVEFSAKSKYLYVGDLGRRLSQYDLTTKDRVSFNASRKTIDSATDYRWTCFQLARDGKIYITEVYNNKLHAINAPDSVGKKAGFQKNAVALYTLFNDGALHVGLPDMVQSFFQKKYFDVRSNCSRDTTFFKISNTYELDSAHWDFDDPGSGTNNYSTKTVNVFHNYKSPGTYRARLVSFHKIFSDTIYESVVINYPKPFLGNDTIICTSDYISLNPLGNYQSYLWNTGVKSKSIFITKAGTYRIMVTDYDGCKTADTIYIQNSNVKADFNLSSTDACFRGNAFSLLESSKYTNGKRQNTKWFFSDSTFATDTFVSKSFSKLGQHSIKMIAKNELGCSDSVTKNVSVHPQSKVDFEINKSIQCFNNHQFDFILKPDTGKINYQWELGDFYINVNADILGKKYTNDTTYLIKLIATTDKNCKDTLTKQIEILPVPKANFRWGIACSKTATKFEYTGTQPISKYFWNFNNEDTSTNAQPSILLTKAGNKKVTLKVTDNNGCTDTLTQEANVKNQSKADFATNDICETDSANFKNLSLDASSYIWKFGDGKTQQISSSITEIKHKYAITASTTFNVSLVALVQDGCSDSIVKPITINENPTSDFSYTLKNTRVDLKADPTNAVIYKWNFGNGDSITSTNSSASYTFDEIPAMYNVCLTVINTAGCQSVSCKQISIVAEIVKNSKQSGYKMYPNPNRGNFNIEIDNPSSFVKIEIYDLMGSLVKNIENMASQGFYPINLPISSGIYLVKVVNGSTVWVKKVVVTNYSD